MKNKFVVDGMLGSLSRKLRIFGYDTLYDSSMGDEEIMKTAEREGRAVVTADRILFTAASRRKVDCILITGEGDEAGLFTVFKSVGGVGRPLSPEDARCAACNGEISRAGKEEVVEVVPEGVLKSLEEFYRCRVCGKVYWVGGHWRRLYELSERVNRRFQQA